MNARNFDTLDLLDTLGNATTLPELVMRLGVTERSVQRRIQQVVDSGLVEAAQDMEKRMVYRPTPAGRRWYHEEMQRMAGVSAPPRQHLDVWNAARIASGAFEAHYGTEAAA